ncbi:MAG: alpha/beta fold hydrolase [Microthrixaceae bacterium]|nr:alpha/beta fold hydrolase [Microthrixaceae bacterium]
MTRTHKPARRALVAAAVAVVSIVLSGCAGLAPAPAPERLPDATGVSEPLLPYYEQEVAWQDCNGGFDCAMITAPLDWADPSAGEIELAVIRQRARDGKPLGSLLTNPGGPGSSGFDFIRDSIDYGVGAKLRQSYDVIGFDPRGVGRSTAVRCFDAAGMDAFLFGIPDAERNSPAWIDEVAADSKKFAAACERNSDGILGFVDTESAARDLDLLRGVLGDTKLHYLGFSYGTFLGATYAKLFPERVGRLVLDGAIDPSVSSLEVGTTQAIGFESALRAFMADCLTQKSCPFRGTVDQGMADLGALLAAAERSPLPTPDGRAVGSDTMLTGVIAALYAQESWGFLREALASALAGEGAQMIFLADFYYNREGGRYLDNSTEAFNAYNCMDYPASTDQAAIDDAAARIREGAPTIAPYWSSDAPDLCEFWPVPAVGTRGPIHAAGAAPILVVGTTNDPATPYAWSVALSEQLDSGVLITRVGEGHTGYNQGNRCVDDAIEAYFLTGAVPTSALQCD